MLPLSEKSKCAIVPVPLHLSALIRRLGDNYDGMTVKEIIGDSMPPDRSCSGLGYLTRCPGKHLFSRCRGSAVKQIGYMGRNSKEDKQWPSLRGLERHRKGEDMFGVEGTALTPSITHLMR